MLQETIPTTVATIDFTWDETLYDEIRVEVSLSPSEDRVLTVQLGYNNGANFHETSGDYDGSLHELGGITWGAMSNTSYHEAAGTGGLSVDASFNTACSGKINIIGGYNTTSTCIIDSLVTFIYGGGGGTPYCYSGQSYLKPIDTADIIDTVRLGWSGAANMTFKAGGTIRYYGLKNS